MEPKEKIDTSHLFQTSGQPEPEQGQQVNEGNEETFENWDKQKAIDGYKNVQRIATKHADRVKELETLLQQKEIENQSTKMFIEQMRQQNAPKPEQQAIPKKPVKPTKPSNYDRLDALTDANSVSARYDVDFQDYLEKMSDYQDYVDSRLGAFEKEKQIEQEKTSQRNSAIQTLINGGASEVEAIEIYNRFTASDNPMNDTKKLIEFYRFLKGSVKPENSPQKANIPSPAVVPNRGEPSTDEANKFLGEMGKKQTSHLFKTIP